MKNQKKTSGSITLTHALCWILFAVPLPSIASTMERIVPEDVAQPIVLQARPDPSVVAWSTEEALPPGSVAVDISDGGQFDPYTSKVKWGPFLDNANRDLSYRIISNQSREIVLSGAASWGNADPVPTSGPDTTTINANGGFHGWLVQYFGPNYQSHPYAFAQSDGDMDGISLLAEYYFGLDPMRFDTTQMQIQGSPGNQFGLTIHRRKAASDVTAYVVQSQDLLNWFPVDSATPSVIAEDEEYEQILYDLGAGIQEAFIRLEFEDPGP